MRHVFFCFALAACDASSGDSQVPIVPGADTTQTGPDGEQAYTCSEDDHGLDEQRLRVDSLERTLTLTLVDDRAALESRVTIIARGAQYFPFTDGPNTWALGLGEAERDTATCTLCVVYERDCGANGCAQTFVATQGALVVDEMPADLLRVRGKLVGVELAEVAPGGTAPRVEGAVATLACVPFDGRQPCDAHADCDVDAPLCLEDDDGLTYCGSFDRCVDDDPREPGDDGAVGATPLALGESVSGRICSTQDEAEREHDVFEVIVDDPGYAVIHLDSAAPDGITVKVTKTPFDFYITTLQHPYFGSDIHRFYLTEGRYHFMVYRDATRVESVPYTLRIAQ